jgi:hypothetical protein
METSDIFDFAPLFAAAITRLRDWFTGSHLRMARRDRDGTPTGAEEARLAREAADRACVRVRRLRGVDGAIAKAVSMIPIQFAEKPAPQRLLVQVFILTKMADA